MSDQTVVTKNETVETLNADGTPLGQNKNLSDIFDRIEAGAKASDAIKEVMSSQQEEPKDQQPLFEKKREDVQPAAPDSTQEVKDEKKQDAVTPDDQSTTKETVEPKDEKKEEGKAESSVEEEVVPDDELKVLPYDKPKTQKRIQALLRKIDSATNEAATTKAELATKAAKLLELEEELKKTKSADPVVTEEIKQQLADLKVYRRKYELEKDPEVQQKFDSRLQSTEASISTILKDGGAGDGLLNLIKEEGGWVKFSGSRRVVALADGTKTTAAELAESIIDNLPYKQRTDIQAAAIEQVQASRDRQRFFDEEAKNAEKYFQEKAQAEAAQREQANKNIEEAKKIIEGWKKKTSESLKEKDIPASARPEERAVIEEENKTIKQIRSIAAKHVEAKTIPEMMQILDDAVAFHVERMENLRLHNQIKALNAKVAEFEKFKSAASVPKQGSLAASGSSPIQERREPKPLTLEERLEQMERGQSAEQ